MSNSLLALRNSDNTSHPIRLGGPVFRKYNSPDEWVRSISSLGYSAAYCPVEFDASGEEIRAYKEAAEKAGIIISEVGAWSNPISSDNDERKNAIEKCVRSLELAERIGASCCVNISGSRGKDWAGPDPRNLTTETFDLIVETTRKIVDAVNPGRTYFTLETMPWAYPDSIESYLRLIESIDRKQFGVHFDPVNLISSPQRYFENGKLIRQFFSKLGPFIKSCHAKDILLSKKLTTHLDEVRPGKGYLDYNVFLSELSQFKDIPLMLEHLPNAAEYEKAAEFIRSRRDELNIRFYSI